MTHSIYPEYPPDLDMERSKYLLENLKDKACTTGFLVKPLATGNGELPEGAIPAPITLFPSLFPSSCFDNAQNIQKQYNLLYASIASDEEWLESIVSTLVGIDDFVENLWKIHLDLRNGGYIQVDYFSPKVAGSSLTIW
jgi:glutathione synthase